VSEQGDSRGTKFEQASSRLDEGLKSCRSIVVNYRAMLKAAQARSKQSARQE
jgi:hypothetical protein